jgi:hypothetical protein
MVSRCRGGASFPTFLGSGAALGSVEPILAALVTLTVAQAALGLLLGNSLS